MTLTEIAYYARKAIKWGSIGFVALLILAILWGPLVAIKNMIIPPPAPKPTVAFGPLPTLPLDQTTKIPQGMQLILQTPTGVLPDNLPTVTNVYFIPSARSGLLDLDRAKQIAQSLNFSTEPLEITNAVYRFPHPLTPAVLDLNIINRAFAISYDLEQTPEILSTRPQSQEDAISLVTSFLSRANLLTEELSSGRTQAKLLKVQGGNLVEAVSLSETMFIQVSLYRKNFDDLPVIAPSPTQGTIWFIVAGGARNNIIAGEYHYFPVDENQKSTYPLKTVEKAWDELAAGGGYILTSQNSTQAIIRRVHLAYFDTGKPQEFLQPVYVFDGDETGSTFRAIVPAISPEYLTTDSSQKPNQ